MALGDICDKQAVDPLLKCLRKDRADLNWCTSAIAKICDPECVKELIDILHNTDNPQKRGAVAKSLGEIGEKSRDKNIENALIEVLDRFGGDNFCDGVKALGKAGGEKALKQLKNMGQCCDDTLKGAIEQIQFRISVGGDNIEEK
jgi:HEAT repeat protein